MKPDSTVMTVMGKVFQDAPPAQSETGALGGFLTQTNGFSSRILMSLYSKWGDKEVQVFYIYYYGCSLTTLGSKVAPDLTATRATRESTTSQPFLKAKECQHFICLQWFCDTAPQESENYAALVIDSDIYSVDFFAKCWNVGLRSSRAHCIAGDGWHLD